MTKTEFEKKIKTYEDKWKKENPEWQIDGFDHSEDETLNHNTIIHFQVGDNRNNLQSVIIAWTTIDNEISNDMVITISNQTYMGYRMEKPFGEEGFTLYNAKDKVVREGIGIEGALQSMILGNLS